MDDKTMTLHDLFVRHRIYKADRSHLEATLRGEKKAYIYDLLQGAAPAGGDLRTDVGLWYADLQSRGLCIDGEEALWASMAASRPDIVWLEPLLGRLKNRHDNNRCRYYLAVLGHVSSARYLSRIDESSHTVSAAFCHGMHLHSKNLERIGSSYEWYPGVETAILVDGCSRLIGIKSADLKVHAIKNWWNANRKDRYAARMDGERRFLSALVRESQTRASMRKAVDEGRVISDPEVEEFGDLLDDDGRLRLKTVTDSTGRAAPRDPTGIEIAAAIDAKIERTKEAGRREAKAQMVVEEKEQPTRSMLVLAGAPLKKSSSGHVMSDNDLTASLDRIYGKEVRLRMPSDEIHAIAKDLREAWPHAGAVIDRVLADLRYDQPVRIRPTLLVGKPGSGKTSLLKALCFELGVPNVVFPCASVSDGSFGGTPAQWSTRRLSTPLELIRVHEVANPVVVLDEIDKSGVGGSGGSLVNALLPMLERHTAEAYFEVGIERKVDLSFVSFIATANDVSSIPAPLKDRFRIIEMPDPGVEHIGSLSRRIIGDLLRERDLDERWTPPLAPDELDIIRRAWGGGSLRRLRRAVEATLSAREMSMTAGRAM